MDKYETFASFLLRGKPAEWLRVQDAYREWGITLGDLPKGLFVTWLADPLGAEGYVLILFYDEESMWTTATRYNGQRLLNGAIVAEEPTAGKATSA